MQSLKPAEVKSIEQFFQLKQENLLKVMYRFLQTKYKKIYYTKDYVFAVGDIPVALVAHLDTVFTSPPENIFYDRTKNVMWSPDGLGADDRAGVYSITQIIKYGLRPSIIFTTDEEMGALGAEALIKDFPKSPVDLKYMIELDRRGSVDCVFYDCDNPEFEEYVESFGFITDWGSFSDISMICPVWGVAGVNLSIGYEHEHSYQEILYISRMLATTKKVITMLESIDKDTKEFKYIPSKYSSYHFSKLYPTDGIWDDWGDFSATKDYSSFLKDRLLTCAYCGGKDFDYNLFPTKTSDGKTIHLCSDCIADSQNVSWCVDCGEPFEVKPSETETKMYCYDCRKEKDTNGTGLLKN